MIPVKNYYYLVNPGTAIHKAISVWFAERDKVAERARELAKEYGVENYMADKDGRLVGLCFKGAIPPDWKKPNKQGVSFPKLRSEALANLQAKQPRQISATDMLREFVSIPHFMQVTQRDGSLKNVDMGHWFTPYQCAGHPMIAQYLLAVPDVPYHVEQERAYGNKVPDAVEAVAKVMEVPGCVPVTYREWELMVLRANQEFEAKKSADCAEAA